MNEYSVKTEGRGISLRWFAETAEEARKEIEEAGHKVKAMKLIQEGTPPVAAGVICRCEESVKICPAHGRQRY